MDRISYSSLLRGLSCTNRSKRGDLQLMDCSRYDCETRWRDEMAVRIRSSMMRGGAMMYIRVCVSGSEARKEAGDVA